MKLIKRALIVLFCAAAAAGALALAACGETPPAPETGYTITVRLPDGSIPQNEIFVQLCTPPDAGGACHSVFADENGVARFPDLEEGEYEVHIEERDWPLGYTFDDTEYRVTKTVKSLTVYFKAAGEADLSALVGNWHSLDKTSYLIEVEEDALYFNGEPLEAKEAADGAFFQVGGVSYVLSRHKLVSGALALRFAENEELLLPESGLARVQVPDALDGTWTCTVDEGITLILDGSNFSFSPYPDSIDDGYTVAVQESGEDCTVVSLIEQGENAGVYTMEYSAETGEITAHAFDATLSFWKSGYGSEGDPTVLDVLEGDYQINIGTSKLQVGFLERYIFIPTYYAYTPEKDETYVLWNPNSSLPDEYQVSIEIYSGLIEDDTAQIVLDWGSYIPEEGYEVFLLEGGTTYRILVSGYPDSSVRPLAGITVSFSVTAGSVPPVTSVPIPEIYHGTWYNVADKTQTVVFQSRRAMWNGAPISVTSAEEEVHATIDGEEVVFTLEGATLKAAKGSETSEFTLLSGHAPAIATVFDGYYASATGDIVVIEGATLTADGEVTSVGSFTWVGHSVQVAAVDTTRLLLVIGNEIWVADVNGQTVVLFLRGSTARTTYSKIDYLDEFSAPYVGTFADAGKTHTLNVTATTFTFDGTAVEVWRTGSLKEGTEKLYFRAGNTVYSLEKSASGLTLTDLASAATWSHVAQK